MDTVIHGAHSMSAWKKIVLFEGSVRRYDTPRKNHAAASPKIPVRMASDRDK